MLEVRQTPTFTAWIEGLRDRVAGKAIGQRLLRVEAGLFGDMHSIGDGVSELRIDTGPGYWVYFTRRGQTIVILLCGESKRGQERDIKRAKALAAELE